MSLPAVMYVASMLLLFVAERLVGGGGVARWALDGVAAAGMAASLGLQLSRLRYHDSDVSRADEDAPRDPGRRYGLGARALLTGMGILSVGLYALGSDALLDSTVLSALWPVIWLSATLPLLAIDRALVHSPVVAPMGRIRQALQHGLAAAFSLAMLVPLNYLADRHHLRWDLAYFQTARPGSATRNILASTSRPAHVYAFLPPASELVQEVDGYFEALEGPNLRYHRVDQTARPRLARRLKVRRNGYIVVTDRGPEALDEAAPQTFRIGTRLNTARDELENLDREFQQRLLAVAGGQRRAYLTTGHGEFTTTGRIKSRRYRNFESVLEQLNFDVARLGLNQGLAEGIPEQADLVVILGPSEGFMSGEIDAFRTYLEERGGSLLVALEPDFERARFGTPGEGDPLRDFLGEFGLQMGDGVLAATEKIVPATHGLADRLNVHTDSFARHPTTDGLAASSRRAALITPSSGWWRLAEEPAKPFGSPVDATVDAPVDATVTVRSRDNVWADLDGDLEFDPEAGEERRSRPIAVALEGGPSRGGPSGSTRSGRTWRALMMADATALSDMVTRNKTNRRFIYDNVNWLLRAEALGGEVRSREDVKIRHTREGQTVWFWSTVAGVPLLVLVAGALRVRGRRRSEDDEQGEPS